jgi:hemerythrin
MLKLTERCTKELVMAESFETIDSIDVFEWDDRYSVGISSLDEQHKKLIALLNELYNECSRKEMDILTFKKELFRIGDYLNYHFKTEETLLTVTSFSGLEKHKQEHEDLVLAIVGNLQNMEKTKQPAPRVFVRYLMDITESHLTLWDKQYAAHLFSPK